MSSFSVAYPCLRWDVSKGDSDDHALLCLGFCVYRPICNSSQVCSLDGRNASSTLSFRFHFDALLNLSEITV